MTIQSNNMGEKQESQAEEWIEIVPYGEGLIDVDKETGLRCFYFESGRNCHLYKNENGKMFYNVKGSINSAPKEP